MFLTSSGHGNQDYILYNESKAPVNGGDGPEARDTGRLRKLGTGDVLFILGYFQNEISKSK